MFSRSFSNLSPTAEELGDGSPDDGFEQPATQKICAYSKLDPYLSATSESGLAFNKVARAAREGGDMTYECPLTIYSAVALAPLGLPPAANDERLRTLILMAPVLFGGVGAAICQAGMVYYIFKLNKDAKIYYDGLGIANY